MRSPETEALCRELGEKYLRQALQHIEQAQKSMRLAEEQLTFVEYVRQSERRATELRERIELFAFALDGRLEHLRAKGGLAVDADILREEIERRKADRDNQILADLIAGWRELCQHHKAPACTVAAALCWLDDELEARLRTPAHPIRFWRLLSALEALCHAGWGALPNARQLSFALRGLRGRVVNGECLDASARAPRGPLWAVRSASAAQSQSAAGGAA